MSAPVVEYLPPAGFHWRVAAGVAAFVMTRTPWFYVAYAILFLWAATSMIVRLVNGDSSWWVDPVVLIGAAAAPFLALVILVVVKQGDIGQFRSGHSMRATLLADRLLLARGDAIDVVIRAGIRRVRTAYGLVFIDADDGRHLVPTRALGSTILSALEADAMTHRAER